MNYEELPFDKVWLPCKFIAKGIYGISESPGGGRKGRGSLISCEWGSTTFVLAITTDFHHVRFLGLFAILATVFAVLLRRAIASRMSAFVFLVLCH